MSDSDNHKNRTRLLIKPPGGYEEFLQLAIKQEWLLQKRHEGGANSPLSYLLLFLSKDETIVLRYIEDELANISYIQITGERNRVVKAARIIEKSLAIYTREEILDDWNSAKEIGEFMDAILAIGVAAPIERDEDFFQCLQKGLQHQEADVRTASVVACSYVLWKDLLPFLENIRDCDPAQDPRDRAKRILDMIQ